MSYLHTQRLLGEHLSKKHHVRQSETVTCTQIMIFGYTYKILTVFWDGLGIAQHGIIQNI